MLTKDLVQATVRSGKLFPRFIKTDDPGACSEAKELCELFSDAAGRVVSDLEEDVKGAVSTPRSRGFAKLLMDQCEVAEPNDEIMDLRWRVFAASERVRKIQDISQNEFAEAVAAELEETVESLRQKIFSDLPSARIVEKYAPLSEEALIDKYNLSHVTTFLCFADDVAVTVTNITIAQKRELMRRLKFHRLMSDVDVDKDAKSITLELSGPLRLFGKAQGYALRIANFFPFVASLPEWKLEALITWRGTKVLFSIDQKSGVATRSSRSHGGYIPKDFEQVMHAINASDEMKIEPGEDFIHLGKQSYCFPDFLVKHGKKSLSLELFHPWHKGQLKQRIEAAEAAKVKGLLIGVERSILKDLILKDFCENNAWFVKNGFEYTQFPTPNVIKRAVTKHD
jgi:uncharacterized protein